MYANYYIYIYIYIWNKKLSTHLVMIYSKYCLHYQLKKISDLMFSFK